MYVQSKEEKTTLLACEFSASLFVLAGKAECPLATPIRDTQRLHAAGLLDQNLRLCVQTFGRWKALGQTMLLPTSLVLDSQ